MMAALRLASGWTSDVRLRAQVPGWPAGDLAARFPGLFCSRIVKNVAARSAHVARDSPVNVAPDPWWRSQSPRKGR
jgi:hypothetical protein